MLNIKFIKNWIKNKKNLNFKWDNHIYHSLVLSGYYSTQNEQSQSIPSSTRVVICGGGLIGTSIAYHLAQLGYKDAILLTKNK